MDRTKENISDLLRNGDFGTDTVDKFKMRLEKGNLTIQENPADHFGIFFAAYDPDDKMLFLGKHRRSGLWLFNGGHIDQGETPADTLKREIPEEWGMQAADFNLTSPALLTVTPIETPPGRYCRLHYDVWYFIPVRKDEFHPLKESLGEEFEETGWKTITEAKGLSDDPTTKSGIEFIERNYFQ